MKLPQFIRATVVVIAGSLLLAGCEMPPPETVQLGNRGLGQELVVNPKTLAATVAANQVPTPQPAVPSVGPKAGDIYQNVQVLGDLSVGEFTRLMAAITEWVSPEEGCNYCHVAGEGFAADTLYTKKVARVMIQMTQNANHIAFESLKQRLEKLKSLTLVFLLGVFVRVSTQVNALTQLVHRLEMFFPQTIEHLQHDLLLDLSHRVTNHGALLVVGSLNCVDNALA